MQVKITSFEIARILPERYFPADRKFIREQLACLDPLTRERIAELYSKVYNEEYEKETEQIKKDNTARRRANTRLREFVQKYKLKNRFFNS